MDLLAYEDVTCESCNAELDWNQRRCDYCHMAYPAEFWNETAKQLNQEWQDSLVDWAVTNSSADDTLMYSSITNPDEQDWVKEDPVQQISEISWLFNLCCDKHMDECTCDFQIPWEETYDVPQQVRDDAYVYRSECSSCNWFYTPSCLSFRSWMIDMLETGDIPDPIDICSFYLLDPALSSTGARR